MKELVERARAKDGILLSERPDRWVVAFDEVVIKVYRKRGGFRGLLDRVFGDRATRAFRAGRVALARGIRVAEPLAAIDGALVMRRVVTGPQAKRAVSGANEGSAGGLVPPITDQIHVVAAARFLRRIHEAHLYPGDFHEKNVLFEAGGEPVLVDYDGLRRVFFVSKRRRIRNLERLYRDFLGENAVSLAMRMRFLLAYANSRSEARELWKKVALRSAKKRLMYGI
jgi:hypothetical protein